MSPSLNRSRLLKWGVPGGVVALVGAAAGIGPLISSARANPSLPPRSPAQLLAAVAEAGRTGLPPMSGTVVETAALGLPALPTSTSAVSPTALLAGSHTVRLWYADPEQVRLALPGSMSETDVIRNGRDLWQWSSETDTATHTQLPGDARAARTPEASPVPRTPQEAANQILAAVGRTTTVSVDGTGSVAGRPVYELVLAPKDSRSLIGQVRLALDSKNYVPLRVQVYPRGGASPAFQVGFTSVTFSRPAATNFRFQPPPGAKVVRTSASAAGHAGKQRAGKQRAATGGLKTIGSGWTSVTMLRVPAVGAGGTTGKTGRTGRTGGAQQAALTEMLLKAATPVHGSWGSGRLLRTKLVSALLTDDGRLFVGAVTPQTLIDAAVHNR